MNHTTRRSRTSPRRLAFASALAALVTAGVLAAPAGAQMHEFTGSVNQVSGERLVVGNRMGDQLSFVRGPKTQVRGAKGEWDSIRRDDRVTVHWDFGEKPARAHRVVVLPPR